MTTLFTVLHLVVAVLLIVVVLGQEGKDPGMKGISGSSANDSFFSMNGGSTKKSFMTKITVALAVLFLITTMVLVLIAG